MRPVSNATAYQVEVLTPDGWRKHACSNCDTRELAVALMDRMRTAAPESEWRVMPVLEAA